MALDDLPQRGSSKLHDEDGQTTVPKSIREREGWSKGDDLEWYSDPDEGFVRVYGPDEELDKNE